MSTRMMTNCLVIALMFAAMPVKAQSPKKSTRPAKPQKHWGIAWYPTCDDAVKAVRGQKKSRPILYLRMLGELAGKT